MSEQHPHDTGRNERQEPSGESNLGTVRDRRRLGERALRELGSEAVVRAASDEPSMAPLEKPSNSNDSSENSQEINANDLPIMLSDEDVIRYRHIILAAIKEDRQRIDDLGRYVAAEDRKDQFQGALYTMNPVISSGLMVREEENKNKN